MIFDLSLHDLAASGLSHIFSRVVKALASLAAFHAWVCRGILHTNHPSHNLEEQTYVEPSGIVDTEVPAPKVEPDVKQT